MVKLSNHSEIDPDNISRPSCDELPPDDRQAYEAFIKECEEESKRRKEKELEEKRRWFLSHFSKNRKGDISKDKEVVILSDEDEQAKSSATVSATTPPTLEQITQLVVNGQEKIFATVQDMIDKSLGKQPLMDYGSAPGFNVDNTFHYNTMHSESSAAYAHYYGMPMNFYNGQKGPEYYRAHGAGGPVMPTGHGGPVPTGPTGSGAVVAYPSSPESITSVPPFSADFSRMNNSYGMVPNNGHMQRVPHTYPNHTPHVPNNSSVNMQKPNNSYFNQILEKHKKDLAIMFKETFGVELKDKTQVCQKPYPESFDSIPYPQNFRVPEFIKFTREDSRTTWEHVSQFNAQMGIYGSLHHLKIRIFPLSLSGTAFSWFLALAPNSVQTWSQLERKFHDDFYNGENDLRLCHLTSVKQKHDESVAEFIRRFRDKKTDVIAWLFLKRILPISS